MEPLPQLLSLSFASLFHVSSLLLFILSSPTTILVFGRFYALFASLATLFLCRVSHEGKEVFSLDSREITL
jgi:hypothetical protein